MLYNGMEGIFMKILLVFTGGTIGSTESGGFVSPDNEKPYKLVNMYKERARNHKDADVIFDILTPYQTLSENINCNNFRLLADCLGNANKDVYDGIIITHGTDTIQYTAAFAGYIMEGYNIPVVFVSANYVLEDTRSNGINNFYYAVEFIRQKKGTGVFVSYCNSGGVPQIHYATRLLMHQSYSDSLYSIGGLYYGYFNNGSFIYRDGESHAPDAKVMEVPGIGISNVPAGSDMSGIMVVHPYPGMYYTMPGDGIRAVLHYTYHSGTICSNACGLKQFASYAKENSIPVFVTGAGDGADYESMKCYNRFGFYVLPKASPEAMYIKLWLCIINNKSTNEIVEIMHKPLAHDIIKN